MDVRIKKNIFSAITYSALLILIILNFSSIIQFLWKFLKGFNPFFLGAAIAFILNKPCMYIEKVLNQKIIKGRGPAISRTMAIILTYLLFLLTLTLIIIIVIPQLTKSIQLLISNITSYTDNLQTLINEAAVFLHLKMIDLSSMEASIFGYAARLESSLTDMVSQIISITTGILIFFTNLLISFIFSIYILYGKEKLLAQFNKFFSTYLPKGIYERCYYVNSIVVDIFNKYVMGQLIGALITGLFCIIGMLIFKFDYPLLIGVLIGVTSLVPLVGSYIGGFISFILLLMINPVKAVWFIVFLIILIQIVGNVIYPKVVGSSMGLPGIWILLSITLGGSLAGPLGILFGLPIAAVLYVLIKNDIRNRT